MYHPVPDAGPFGLHWGETKQIVSALVPLMNGIEVSLIPGIPTSASSLVSHAQADGNGNMSSVMIDCKPWSGLGPDSHGPVPEVLVA